MTFNVYYTGRAQLDSSFVNRAWYDRDTHTLTLELNNSVYQYAEVPAYVYDSLVYAPSAGTYYRQNISGLFAGGRLGPVTDMVQIDRKAVLPPFAVRQGEQVVPAAIAKVDLTKVQKIPLPAVGTQVGPQVFDYTLHFSLSDGDQESEERSHTLKAASLDDAIEDLFDLADTLGRTLTLKGASVRFD